MTSQAMTSQPKCRLGRTQSLDWVWNPRQLLMLKDCSPLFCCYVRPQLGRTLSPCLDWVSNPCQLLMLNDSAAHWIVTAFDRSLKEFQLPHCTDWVWKPHQLLSRNYSAFCTLDCCCVRPQLLEELSYPALDWVSNTCQLLSMKLQCIVAALHHRPLFISMFESVEKVSARLVRK